MKKGVVKKKVKNHDFNFWNFISEKYRESFQFIRDSKKYIYSIIWIFLAFSLIGFFVPLPEEMSNKIIDYFRELILETDGFSFFEMAGYLFENNVYASFFGMIFGIALGIFSIFNAIVNGFVVGFASNLSVANAGLISLWRLLPHGIFELPALFLSLGIGLRLGSIPFTKESFKKTLIGSLRAFGLVIVPLLILAAFIESALIVFGI